MKLFLMTFFLGLNASAGLQTCIKLMIGVYGPQFQEIQLRNNLRIKNYDEFLSFLNGKKLSSAAELTEYKKFVGSSFLPLLEQVLTYSGVFYLKQPFFATYRDRLLSAVQNREWFESDKDSFVAIVIPKEGQVHPELKKLFSSGSFDQLVIDPYLPHYVSGIKNGITVHSDFVPGKAVVLSGKSFNEIIQNEKSFPDKLTGRKLLGIELKRAADYATRIRFGFNAWSAFSFNNPNSGKTPFTSKAITILSEIFPNLLSHAQKFRTEFNAQFSPMGGGQYPIGLREHLVRLTDLSKLEFQYLRTPQQVTRFAEDITRYLFHVDVIAHEILQFKEFFSSDFDSNNWNLAFDQERHEFVYSLSNKVQEKAIRFFVYLPEQRMLLTDFHVSSDQMTRFFNSYTKPFSLLIEGSKVIVDQVTPQLAKLTKALFDEIAELNQDPNNPDKQRRLIARIDLIQRQLKEVESVLKDMDGT